MEETTGNGQAQTCSLPLVPFGSHPPSLFLLHTSSCTAYLVQKHVVPTATRLAILTRLKMILESERGFNYTLTRDKLAMNLGSPPRKPKNVTPASLPAPARSSSTTIPRTTTTTNPAADTTPFPPFELPEPTRYELSAESDNRVATLEAQVESLTRKGAEAGEFGCYPCLCDTSRCICICTSHLILPPFYLFSFD